MANKVEAGKAYITLAIQSTISQGLSTARRAIDSFAKNTNSTLSSIGKGISLPSLGLGGLGAAGAGLSLAGPISEFAKYEAELLKLKASADLSDSSLAKLRESIEQTSRSTGVPLLDVARVGVEAGRAGLDVDSIARISELTAKLAKSTDADSQLVFKALSDIGSQFGLTVDQISLAADKIFKASDSSKTDVSSLAESLKFSGPVASQFGGSLDQVLALTGALAEVGIRGEQAGTSLRALQQFALADRDRLSKIFEVDFDAADKTIDVFRKISTAVQGLSDQERAKRFGDAFGLVGVTPAAGLIATLGKFDEFLAKIETSEGALNEAFEQITSGSQGAIDKLSSSLSVVRTRIGEAFAGGILKFINPKTIEAATSGLVKFVSENKELLGTLAIGAAAFAAVTAAVTAFGLALAAVPFAVAGAKMVAVVSAISAAVAGLIAVTGSDKVAKWFQDTADVGGNAFSTLKNGVVELTDEVNTFVDLLSDGSIDDAMKYAAIVFEQAWLDAFESIKTGASRLIKGTIDANVTALKTIFKLSDPGDQLRLAFFGPTPGNKSDQAALETLSAVSSVVRDAIGQGQGQGQGQEAPAQQLSRREVLEAEKRRIEEALAANRLREAEDRARKAEELKAEREANKTPLFPPKPLPEPEKLPEPEQPESPQPEKPTTPSVGESRIPEFIRQIEDARKASIKSFGGFDRSVTQNFVQSTSSDLVKLTRELLKAQQEEATAQRSQATATDRLAKAIETAPAWRFS